ncbi:MAG: SPOR domain-containing protein [Acidobacteria bacterium]|nr:SPOR domain-containing protein [Acidobacteriota bacterium]
MSELHEETHYQIALTNRQVLTAFVILLGCLFVAFFAGVRIGRDVLSGTDKEATAKAGEASDESDLADELAFFSSTSGTRKSSAPKAVGTDRPGRGQPGRDRSALGNTQPTLEPRAATPSVAEEPLFAEESQARDAQIESALPSPVVMRPGELARGADPRLPAAASGSPAVIQVFSSTDRSQAQSILERLTSAGFKGYLSPFTIDGQEHYRVRVGPLPDREQAVEQAVRLERELGLDTWIPSTID